MTAPPSFRLRWGPLLLAWGLLALIFLPQALILNEARPQPAPGWLVALRNGQIFLLWALFTPLAFAALRRWPPVGPARWRHRTILVAVGLGLAALHLALMVATAVPLLPEPRPLGQLIGSMATGLAATNVLMAATVFAAAQALLQAQARRQAESQLLEARLDALRQQLQPHFLFNTLNALAELVHRDAARAESLLLRLSALLRRALDGGSQRRIALREELGFVDDYLAIQQALFGERLRIERAIEADCLDAPLPPMLLQPLVENALRHGLAPLRRGGCLRLAARRVGDTLELGVEDDGAGLGEPCREGIGLANTRQRLAAEYAGAASLQLSPREGGGTRATLHLPWHRA
jgi:two-component system, LytTR family, sensor kinase